MPLLIDQGTADEFLAQQLHPASLERVCAARHFPLTLRMQDDYDHSYHFIATFIGEHLPELVPFMTGTYTPQAVNQARSAFKRKVKKAGATFFYGAMCGFFTAEELDDILFEASEVAKFLLEVEGTSLEIDEEISIEDRITHVMRNVAESAAKVLKAREAGEDQRLSEGGGMVPGEDQDQGPGA